MAPVRRSKRSTAEAIPRPLDFDPGAFQFQPNLDPSTFSPTQPRSSTSGDSSASNDIQPSSHPPQSPQPDSLFDTAALAVTPGTLAQLSSVFSETPSAERIAAQSPASAAPLSSRPAGRGSSFTFLEPLTSTTPIFPLRRQSHITLGGRRSSRSQAARRVVSHAAKKPDGHIPRPPNCFLLYRSWVRQQNKLYGKGSEQKKNEQNVSVIVGTLWEDLPEEKKEIFRAEARRLKEEHMTRYPGYKYAPRSRKDKSSTNGNSANNSDSGTRTQPKRITKKMAPEEAASAVKEANEIIARERQVRAAADEAEAFGDASSDQIFGAGFSSATSTSRTYQQPLSFIPYRRSSSCPPVGETLASLSTTTSLTFPIRRPSPPTVSRAPNAEHTTLTGPGKSSSSRKGPMNGGIDLPSVSFNAPSFNGSVARRTPLPVHGTASPYPPPSARPRGAAPAPIFDPNYAPTRSYDPLTQGPNSSPSSSGSGRRGGLHTDDLEQREAIEEAARSRAPQVAPGAGLFDPGYSLTTYSLSGNQSRMVAQGGSPPAYPPPAYPPPPQMNIGSPMPVMTDNGTYVPQSPLDGTAPAFQALGLNSPVSAAPTIQFPHSAVPPAHDGWIQDRSTGGYIHDASAPTGYAMQYDGSAYATHHPYHHQSGDGMIGGVQESVPLLDYNHIGGVDPTMGGMMGDNSRGMDYPNPMQLAPLEILPTHKELPPYPLSDPSQHIPPQPSQFHPHQQNPPLRQLGINQHQPGNGFSPPSATPGYSSSSSASSTPQPLNGILPAPIDIQKGNNMYTSPVSAHPPPHSSRANPSPRSPFIAVPQPVSAIPPRLSASGDIFFDWNAASASPTVATHPHTSQTHNAQHHHNVVSQISPSTMDMFPPGVYDMGTYGSSGHTEYGGVNSGNAGSYGAPVTTGAAYGFSTGSGFGGSASGSLGLGGRRLSSRRTSSLWMRSSLAGDLAGVGLGEF